MTKIVIHWFRRDLRLEDNTALSKALKSGLKVLPIFIFDQRILVQLEQSDPRLSFIHQELSKINEQLSVLGSGIATFNGNVLEIWAQIIQSYSIEAVYTNHDYEPYAIERDQSVETLLKAHQISFHTFKDQCIFEKNDILKNDGTAYTVFTPYKSKWLLALNEYVFQKNETALNSPNFLKEKQPFLSLRAIGFEKNKMVSIPIFQLNVIEKYAETRDFPAIEGTSKISVHLRFGTLSIRKIIQLALAKKAYKWLDELIWREFYMMILWHFPHTLNQAFKPKYDQIAWLNNEKEFELWSKGQTGYPLVDAAMRQLNETGWMHNRLRMLTASFLCKHLLIDWRWGAAYFAQKLLDFEAASNIGGWQWACGSGNDSAPYFRIFNPEIQQKKFDAKGLFIRQWIPELQTFQYPKPIIDHTFARNRCLEVYKKALM